MKDSHLLRMASDALQREGFWVWHHGIPEKLIFSAQRTLDFFTPDLNPGVLFYWEPTIHGAVAQVGRAEKFLEVQPVFQELIFFKPALEVLADFFGDVPTLLKEKVNFKHPGAPAYPPHQDHPAYSMFPVSRYLTVVVCLDAFSKDNGALWFAPGRHREGVFAYNDRGEILPELAASFRWIPVEATPGSVIIFDSFVPHRSDPNRTQSSRRALFSTFNSKILGNFREQYFSMKEKAFPSGKNQTPEKEKPNNFFNFANPFI